MTDLRVACIQMRSGIEIATNITQASALIEEAANLGAHFIITPEMTNLVDIRSGMGLAKASLEAECPALSTFCTLASKLNVHLQIGSLAIRLDAENQLANRAYLISPKGQIIARYDKIHMFDVQVDDGQSYRESHTYKAGTEAVLARTPFANIGLSICYDLRFPVLYRTLAKAGAHILTCPAAFTHVTGKAHWHTLLCARAIENGAFMLAPAQTGHHEDGRQTYGHSLIISPWGEIIAERAEDAPGVLMATLDMDTVTKARARIPALSHDKDIHLKIF